MDDRTPIQKDRMPMYIKMTIVTVIAAVLFALTSRLLRMIDSILSVDSSDSISLFRAIALVVALLSIVMTWIYENSQKYYLEDGTLLIAKSSMLGSVDEKQIKLSSVNQLLVKQSVLGKMLGYGSVYVFVKDQPKEQRVCLRNIKSPENITTELKARS